ncbi:bifunctional 4-hydroxy-2-oxoglutarate aldolase/2-dehydro-3-deoxy-phosphogluconate aldolase [Gluconacetobacter johannae]|uniref:2-dehydro-3-deoxy-phosphogluconate aldolase n=1 Tax=Gluconacetobacter johannae TaxID=112140 RepID=A0A7W4P3Y6_9PROT|nr:bifunctional 4-hydroxy-2-oxoglutarate aldolase/2-dehydro-3-deoxy-phosphogluconate aldolase [Gluconacetobacter johannae]MBB2176339.1 bifunctional 4-hydroxy-2-oxoglutarate aldolase/2-dehydro-3-deoxy-phosphogluconate aldolase [Gluconacetobacter johannae]
MSEIDRIMGLSPVIPVLVVQDAAHARPIAEALVAGGLRVLEVTLRTEAALDVIAEMAKVEGAVVGAGTVLNEADLDASIEAGAEFIVSPGLTDGLARAAIARRIPFLPGIANSSDIMRGLDLGLDRFKFFPAEASGGIKALKALSAPFGRIRFCPTGGIDLERAPQWLELPSVRCVGGSWLVPPGAPDGAEIRHRAAAAAQLATTR